MQRLEYRTIDKSGWGDGPWQSEPDKIQWQDEETGYPCLIVRNDHFGFCCGYVGVSKGHPLHGKDYDAAHEVEVHGGLTFAHSCGHGDEATGICHKPDPGEPDDVWWLGFDCGHAWDQAPGIDCKYPERAVRDSVYRDVAYVTAECQKLAQQLKRIADGGIP